MYKFFLCVDIIMDYDEVNGALTIYRLKKEYHQQVREHRGKVANTVEKSANKLSPHISVAGIDCSFRDTHAHPQFGHGFHMHIHFLLYPPPPPPISHVLMCTRMLSNTCFWGGGFSNRKTGA